MYDTSFIMGSRLIYEVGLGFPTLGRSQHRDPV